MNTKKMILANIGSGSSYLPDIAEMLIERKDTMKVAEWRLMDIDEYRLKCTGRYVEKMFKEAGMETVITMTTDTYPVLRRIMAIYHQSGDDCSDDSVQRIADEVAMDAKSVRKYIDTLGTISSLHSVNIVPQVSGQIVKINFEQGQFVKEGDVLAEIDPRPYAAAVMQAEGNLRQAEAQLKIDALDVERNRKLAKDNYVDKQTFDSYLAKVEADKAYCAAIGSSEELMKSDPVRLGTILNYAVFNHEHMDRTERAIELVKEAMESVGSEFAKMSDNAKAELLSIVNAMKNNLAHWEGNGDDVSGEEEEEE